MKLTAEQLRQIIKEELDGMNMGTQFTGKLDVTSKPEGGWTITGVFNGQNVNIDSAQSKSYSADMGEWDNSPRFMMARELLGYFGEHNEYFKVRKQDLDNVEITVDGDPV